MIGDIFQPTHLLFLLVVVLIVLGPKRLPEMARSLGKGMRDFKDAVSGVNPMDELQQHQQAMATPPPVAPQPTTSPVSQQSTPPAPTPELSTDSPSPTTPAPPPPMAPADPGISSTPAAQPQAADSPALKDPVEAVVVPSSEDSSGPTE